VPVIPGNHWGFRQVRARELRVSAQIWAHPSIAPSGRRLEDSRQPLASGWRGCCPCSSRTSDKEDPVSQRMVAILIDRLLADKDLRIRFALDRFETLADLSFLGVDLTSDEIDTFIRTDVRLWFQDRVVVGEQVH
jgi:hypothetical protein